MLNGGEEGNKRMKGGGHDEEVASSEKKDKFKTGVQKSIPYQFITKMVAKWL